MCPAAAGLYADRSEPGGPRGDSGLDLPFPRDVAVAPGAAAEILDLGVRVRCVRHGEFVPFLLVPRSSIGLTPLSLANSVGIVDRGFSGTLKVAVRNHEASAVWRGRRGDALFQLVLPGLELATVEVVGAEHDAFRLPTLRASGAFGSTGAAPQKEAPRGPAPEPTSRPSSAPSRAGQGHGS